MSYTLFITLYRVVRKFELKTLVQRSNIFNLDYTSGHGQSVPSILSKPISKQYIYLKTK